MDISYLLLIFFLHYVHLFCASFYYIGSYQVQDFYFVYVICTCVAMLCLTKCQTPQI